MLPHGTAAKGLPKCEIAVPWGPGQREIQSVKLRRLPWGLRSLRLPRGGSSRGGGEQAPKPYPCLLVQHTLKLPLLQIMPPISLWPLACPSRAEHHAQQHGAPARWCHLLSHYSSPAHPCPSPDTSPSPHTPLLASRKPPQHPPVPTGGLPVPTSLQEPIPGPWIQLGWKMQKRTKGD